ncbi:MAG TPA: DUF2892 domain-containing protein [Puia sp.]|nr:DUF2892 domain-containing protein [Puia sp.]
MKKNEGVVDCFVRFFISVILVNLAIQKTVTGFWNSLLWIFAGIFFLTAYLGWSPFYAIFRIHTNRRKKSPDR